MTDYTDLIARLDMAASECAKHGMIGDASHMREAAAAIAALTAERDALREALQKAHEALLWCARDGRMASPLLHQYPAKWAEEARAALTSPPRTAG